MPSIASSLAKSHYLKVGLEDARDVRLLLSANQSERSFQIGVQWIYNFYFSFQRRTCFVYAMRDRLLLVPYDACGTNQIEAKLLVATFVKYRGTISQYLNV